MATGATAFFLVYLIIMGIAALVLYTIIRLAVRNGVREAIKKQELQLQIITDLLTALVKEKYKSDQ